ncbi:MAG: ferritin-like domain-containing protein [Bryobacteraceae bacterium]|nr:ferritin-like domain-containing protein [Bryobacteraceae bacterium]
MGLFTSKQFNSLDELLLDQLKDLYDAEHRVIEALPLMAEAAHSSVLKEAFLKHLDQTKVQAARLEQIFQHLGVSPERHTCDAIKGIVKEGDDVVQAKGDPDVKDAALIAAAQRVEHYEIAGYGTARTFAHRLGHRDVADLLQQTLDEEGETDHLLTEIAEQSVNVKAQHAGAI